MNDTTKPSEYLGYWGEKYKNDLLTDILPFWLKYGIDHENGGYFTCLDRDGSLLDTNKSVWFQGRFAFILAYAYNNLEKQAEWLEACKNGIDFIEKYCFDTDGRMFYEVTKTGTPVRKRRYVFSETFAAIAMAQYSIASGDKSYAEKAVKLFKQILYYKNTPGALEPKFREGFVAKGHSFCMILIDTAARIREAVDDPVLTRQIDESIAELRRDFMKPEFKAILETVGSDPAPSQGGNPRLEERRIYRFDSRPDHQSGPFHRNGMVHPRRGQAPELGPAAEADRAHDPGLVLGMGLGQNTRWNHLF